MCTGALQGCPISIIGWARDRALHFCSGAYLKDPGVLLKILPAIPFSFFSSPKVESFSTEKLPEEASLASTTIICSSSAVGSQAPSCPTALCVANTMDGLYSPRRGITHPLHLSRAPLWGKKKKKRGFESMHHSFGLILVILALL